MNAIICQTNEPTTIEPDYDCDGYAFEHGVMAPFYKGSDSPDELKVYELARKLTRSTCKNEQGEELILITQEAVDLASDYLHYESGGYCYTAPEGRCLACLDHLSPSDRGDACRWCDERFAEVKKRLETNRVNN
jgi:hypothetical protein